MQSGLTPFDLTALRSLVTGALVLPFAKAWAAPPAAARNPVDVNLWSRRAIQHFDVLWVEGGVGGIRGAFANGSLPIFTILLGLLVARRVPSQRQLIAVLILLVGAVLVAIPGMRAGGNSVASAIGFFLAA
ncbi:hypothetical protein [Bradyrhizobium sp. IC3195]|uniref:hypothetical protein n=1 Tax=Bradyrhizobium sp. IC3195 TaxID=2793804 RepID=UPI0032119760